MISNRKLLRGSLLALLGLLAGGCGGINTSGTVSPATFLLPGVVRREAPVVPKPESPPAGQPVVALAQAR